MKRKYFAWYADGSYDVAAADGETLGYSGADWYEAETAQEAAKLAKADGCQWTTVRITEDANTQPYGKNVLAEA